MASRPIIGTQTVDGERDTITIVEVVHNTPYGRGIWSTHKLKILSVVVFSSLFYSSMISTEQRYIVWWCTNEQLFIPYVVGK